MSRLREARELLATGGVTGGSYYVDPDPEAYEDGRVPADAGCYCAVGALRKAHDSVRGDRNAPDVARYLVDLERLATYIRSAPTRFSLEDTVIRWNDSLFEGLLPGDPGRERAAAAVIALFDKAIETLDE